MFFDLTFPLFSIIAFSVAAVALIFILTFYLARWRRVTKHCHDLSEDEFPPRIPASVVVYAQDDAESLEKALEGILAQVYPAGFEVIVVNDGASEEVRQVVGQLKVTHPNLYLTFTPDGARSLSRKKLAITIGVKAAHSPVVVITDARTKILSETWLRGMMKPFENPDIQVVLGARMPDASADDSIGHRRRAYDFAAAAVCWLSAAIGGSPYRGCGANVAYRRQLFFDNKGFSRSLNLRNGDDDIFINEITTPDNTAVQLRPDTVTCWNIYNYKKEMERERLAHVFTGERVPKCSRRLMAFGQWSMWLVVIAAVFGAIFMGFANYAGWIIAALLVLIMLFVVGFTESRTLNALYGEMSPRLSFSIPFLAMTRPMRNIFASIRSRIHRQRNYTWS